MRAWLIFVVACAAAACGSEDADHPGARAGTGAGGSRAGGGNGGNDTGGTGNGGNDTGGAGNGGNDTGGAGNGGSLTGGDGSGGESTAGTPAGGFGGDNPAGESGASGAGTSGTGGAGGTESIEGRPISPLYGAIVFNEILTDASAEGDPNGDGDHGLFDDQFVELVNVSQSAIPLNGFALVERDFPALPRHTFGSVSLAAGSAVVVFGGGDAPNASGTTTFLVANAADPGLPFGLALSPTDDSLLLLDDAGAVVARFCYGSSAECDLAPATDRSLTRSPDLTGPFVPHDSASGANGSAFSVGLRVDTTPF